MVRFIAVRFLWGANALQYTLPTAVLSVTCLGAM